MHHHHVLNAVGSLPQSHPRPQYVVITFLLVVPPSWWRLGCKVTSLLGVAIVPLSLSPCRCRGVVEGKVWGLKRRVGKVASKGGVERTRRVLVYSWEDARPRLQRRHRATARVTASLSRRVGGRGGESGQVGKVAKGEAGQQGRRARGRGGERANGRRCLGLGTSETVRQRDWPEGSLMIERPARGRSVVTKLSQGFT